MKPSALLRYIPLTLGLLSWVFAALYFLPPAYLHHLHFLVGHTKVVQKIGSVSFIFAATGVLMGIGLCLFRFDNPTQPSNRPILLFGCWLAVGALLMNLFGFPW